MKHRPNLEDMNDLKDFQHQTNLKCCWLIEYEIPPLRAIYQAEAGPCFKDEVLAMVREQQPLWRIRKLEPIQGQDYEMLEL